MTHLEKMEFFCTKNHFTYRNDRFVILLFGLTVDRVIEQSRCVTSPMSNVAFLRPTVMEQVLVMLSIARAEG